MYNLNCFLLELTVGVPTEDTLQEKVCAMNFVINRPLKLGRFVFPF